MVEIAPLFLAHRLIVPGALARSKHRVLELSADRRVYDRGHAGDPRVLHTPGDSHVGNAGIPVVQPGGLGGRTRATGSSPVGWRPGKFFRLPPCEEGGDTARGADMGGVPVAAVPPASDIRHPSFRHSVCTRRGSDSKHV